MRPPVRVARALCGIRKACVGHAQKCSIWLLDEVDLDQAGPRRHLITAFPTERIGQAMHWHDLTKRAAGQAGTGDVDEIEAAGLWLDLGVSPHPSQDFLRVS